MTRTKSIRRRSSITLFGLPLYDIAFGSKADKSEARGQARGYVAIGDFATGVIAIGGVAKGVVAIGVLAMGGVAVGGVSLGVVGLGVIAIGGLAIGGAAVGVVAVGGMALGYYSLGGMAFGEYPYSTLHHDLDARDFFRQWLPDLGKR
jgi:hypothetical protein